MASLDSNQLIQDIPMEDDPDLDNETDAVKLENSDEEDDESDVESITDHSSVDELEAVIQGLAIKELPTGLCYDERMRYHAEVAALSDQSIHPEDPRRIYYIFKELCEAGLVKAKGYTTMVEQPLLRIDAREATEEEICLVHTDDHYRFVESTSRLSDSELIDLAESEHMDSIYFNTLSYYSGKLSAGGAIETCKAVMERRVKNAIAVIRPPGHHAEVDQTMGFCLFNNTCIASRVCQGLYGQACRKILILDWDVHHGNGCQKAFYTDPNILYISLHVHANGHFYPPGPEGGADRVGEGPGRGFNVNIPWDVKGMGDGDYMYAFQNVVMPIATEFDPDFVIVSAGFDAAAGDELGGCNVTPPCYAHMTHMLMSLAGGKVAVCLEGGYNFRAISKSALAVTRTLMGEPPDRLYPTRPSESAVKVIGDVRRIQSRYWRSIYPKEADRGIFGGERLHDILREWQAMHLYDKFKLTELHIFRDTISRSFEKQVLATPAHDAKQHLIVFFHDPPDLLGPMNQLTNDIKPHDTWMLDATQSYVARAVSKRIAVIDVNIPEYITITPDQRVDPNGIHRGRAVEYASTTTDVARQEAGKLAEYIWENYVEPFDFEGGVWLIGAGNAFHAVAKLVGENENLYSRLNGVVSFICHNPVRPISSTYTPWVTQWYREHSKVFVAGDHSVWQREENGKKLSKKYGKIIRSPETVLNSMMLYHIDEVFEWIRQTGRFDASMNDTDDEDGDPDATEDDEEEVAMYGQRRHQRQYGNTGRQGRNFTGTQVASQALAQAQAQGSSPRAQQRPGYSSRNSSANVAGTGNTPAISVASPSPGPSSNTRAQQQQQQHQMTPGQFYGSATASPRPTPSQTGSQPTQQPVSQRRRTPQPQTQARASPQPQPRQSPAVSPQQARVQQQRSQPPSQSTSRRATPGATTISSTATVMGAGADARRTPQPQPQPQPQPTVPFQSGPVFTGLGSGALSPAHMSRSSSTQGQNFSTAMQRQSSGTPAAVATPATATTPAQSQSTPVVPATAGPPPATMAATASQSTNPTSPPPLEQIRASPIATAATAVPEVVAVDDTATGQANAAPDQMEIERPSQPQQQQEQQREDVEME